MHSVLPCAPVGVTGFISLFLFVYVVILEAATGCTDVIFSAGVEILGAISSARWPCTSCCTGALTLSSLVPLLPLPKAEAFVQRIAWSLDKTFFVLSLLLESLHQLRL